MTSEGPRQPRCGVPRLAHGVLRVGREMLCSVECPMQTNQRGLCFSDDYGEREMQRTLEETI